MEYQQEVSITLNIQTRLTIGIQSLIEDSFEYLLIRRFIGDTCRTGAK